MCEGESESETFNENNTLIIGILGKEIVFLIIKHSKGVTLKSEICEVIKI